MALDADLNDLGVFVQVVESRSFTGAGKRLGMPRSTVSRRVAALERRLGVRLLHRTTRKLELTDLGATYYERCASSLRAIGEAEAEVKSAQAEPRGRLRMTAPHDLGNLIAPMMATFIERHPQVRVEVELSQRMVDLVGEGFDLALRATGQLPDSSLVARRLGGGLGALFASARYLEAHGTPKSPHELRDHRLVVLGLDTTAWRLEGEGGEVTVAVSPVIRVNDPGFARDAAVAGAGIAVLPSFIVSEEEHDLVPVLPSYHAFRSSLFVVYPSAKHLSATVRAFRDHLVGAFDALPLGAALKPIAPAPSTTSP